MRRRLRAAGFALLLIAAQVGAQQPTPPPQNAPVAILQINDVYETVPVDGLGGLARVATLKKNLARTGATPLLVIAGDFLSSSVASSIFKGRQMIDAFNVMGLDLATLGNHEFDFGKEILLQRMAESKFQYVVSNVLDEATGRPVGGAAPYLVRTFAGLKVGFFGLCLIDEEVSLEKRRGLRFIDPLTAADSAIGALKREGADAIVAVTHLSYATDRALAERFPELSVIIGGHEHTPITAVVGGTLISKAGSDAKWVARIDLRYGRGRVDREFALLPIDTKLPDDPATAAVVAEYESKLAGELDAVIATAEVPLDADARRLRTSETNAGNLVADAMRTDRGADLAIINSGSIRGDRVYPPGPVSRRTLLAMQPFGNVVCEVEVTGSIVVRALNAGASQWPAAAGRFPQVSGLAFVIDSKRPAGDRVVDVRVGGAPIDLNRTYRVAIPDYLLNGGDGYNMFGGQRVLVGPESGTLIVGALEKAVVAQRAIAPQIEGRVTIR